MTVPQEEQRLPKANLSGFPDTALSELRPGDVIQVMCPHGRRLVTLEVTRGLQLNRVHAIDLGAAGPITRAYFITGLLGTPHNQRRVIIVNNGKPDDLMACPECHVHNSAPGH